MKNELIKYENLVTFLNNTLDERYEVSLISLSDIDLDNIQDHDSTPGLISDIMCSHELKKRDYLCSYSKSQDDAFGEKKSIYYIKDKKNNIIGFICIKEKENPTVNVRDVFNQIFESDDKAKKNYTSQKVGKEVEDLMRERIIKVWEKHKSGKEKLSKAEKIDVVRELLENGIFRMKGTAAMVTEVTGISQATLYRYLSVVIEE